MNTLQIALSSKGTWLIAGAVAIAVLNVLVPHLTGGWLTGAQDLLLVLGLFVTPAEIKTAGSTGKLAGRTI